MRMHGKRASKVCFALSVEGIANRHCSNPAATGTSPPAFLYKTKSLCPASSLDAEIACERYSIGPERMAKGHRNKGMARRDKCERS